MLSGGNVISERESVLGSLTSTVVRNDCFIYLSQHVLDIAENYTDAYSILRYIDIVDDYKADQLSIVI